MNIKIKLFLGAAFSVIAGMASVSAVAATPQTIYIFAANDSTPIFGKPVPGSIALTVNNQVLQVGSFWSGIQPSSPTNIAVTFNGTVVPNATGTVDGQSININLSSIPLSTLGSTTYYIAFSMSASIIKNIGYGSCVGSTIHTLGTAPYYAVCYF